MYGVFYKRLYHFSLSLVRLPDTAQEVVEDVFTKLWINRTRLTAIANPSVYLYVAVKNQSLNRLSVKAREWIFSGLDETTTSVAAVGSDPLSQLMTAEMLSRVNHAIEQLPSRCKMIFKLVREDGLRYKEVAEILNISVNTIDAQMAIAVRRISESLGISKNIRQKPFVKKK
ncbi:RNA polymerase sigma-70 factor [Niabella aurantiaca]|uniref:RNA polymerase sigma-70 factor n=1 Tax=Niabella aurantiaca TaxID=379900 RepID=UPI0003726B8D|nr:RNA polymerase sigma-70 factor [Niabella aurantiaca]